MVNGCFLHPPHVHAQLRVDGSGFLAQQVKLRMYPPVCVDILYLS